MKDKILDLGFTKTLENENEVIWKIDDEDGIVRLSFGVMKNVGAIFIKGGFDLEVGKAILEYAEEITKKWKEKQN